MSETEYGYDEGKLPEYVEQLNKILKLRATPTAIKLFKKKADMEAVAKIRVPKPGEIFSPCQMFGQTTRLNFTVGFTRESLPSPHCAGICGLAAEADVRKSDHLNGTWFGSREDALNHQEALQLLGENYEAVASSPAGSGRLKQPDVILAYGTPQQIMFMACGLQYDAYQRIEGSFVGESSCTDSWVRSIATRAPCVAIPCFAERRFGGVPDDEMVIAFPPRLIAKMLDGLQRLSRNGMRYPASPYGIQNDARAGMGVSYDLAALNK